ncbi:hypothetical protein TRVL_02721 [Trypanosoma vivax]|nr:hypothetical protein TRVL_02721 [Trypanosoma vivax]
MFLRGVSDGFARGGRTILVRDGVGVEVGVLDKKVPEKTTSTLRFSAGVTLTITSTRLQRQGNVCGEVLGSLQEKRAPLVAKANAHSYHSLCDPMRSSGDKGKYIVDCCVEDDPPIAKTE